MKINLVFLSGNTTGGWITFTSHLTRSLRLEGYKVRLYKRGKNSETRRRPFGYGLSYRNKTERDLVRVTRRASTIIVAVQKNFTDTAQRLLDVGAKIVVHDPAEKSGKLRIRSQPWVIRRAGLRHLKNAVFIPHPYLRQNVRDDRRKKTGCVSVSRIDFDKNTHILLDANRLGAKIRIHGFENRLYTKFSLGKKYPEWKQSQAAYPREHDAAFKILKNAVSMADMSIIKGDGGGTQYTTLEAWDAGTVPIVHSDWIRKKDELRPFKNCLIAWDGQSLKGATLLAKRNHQIREKVLAGGRKALRDHAPAVVVPQIIKWLRTK